MPSPDREPTEYLCPGETHPITRAVHLARLAAFYPACRECPHRHDTGQLPQELVGQFAETQRRAPRPSWLTGEGVRAVYLNELDRPRAADWAAALALRLWEEIPRQGRATPVPADELEASTSPRRLPGPGVVVGYDERPSSPDIFAGVLLGLRRMGCQVIDIGLTTKPCWRFAVHHLEASAGIYVTGAGCDPAWTGFDLAGRSGIPLPQGTVLTELEQQSRLAPARPTRQAGAVRSFQAMHPYRAGLRRHFHALRPLRLACGQPGGLGPRWLEQLFTELPCRLVPVPLPVRRRRLDDPGDADIVRVAECVRQQGLDLGLVIDDDGERCSVLDETGNLLNQHQLVGLLCQRLLCDHPAGTVVVSTELAAGIETLVATLRGRLVVASPDPAELARSVHAEHAVIGSGNDHRCWFDEDYPACDAVLTLAAVLQALSWSDAPLSEVAAAD